MKLFMFHVFVRLVRLEFDGDRSIHCWEIVAASIVGERIHSASLSFHSFPKHSVLKLKESSPLCLFREFFFLSSFLLPRFFCLTEQLYLGMSRIDSVRVERETARVKGDSRDTG